MEIIVEQLPIIIKIQHVRGQDLLAHICLDIRVWTYVLMAPEL